MKKCKQSQERNIKRNVNERILNNLEKKEEALSVYTLNIEPLDNSTLYFVLWRNAQDNRKHVYKI